LLVKGNNISRVVICDKKTPIRREGDAGRGREPRGKHLAKHSKKITSHLLENNTIKTGKITLKQQGKIPKKMGKTHLKKIGKHNFFFVKLQGQHLVLSAASQITFERVSHSRKKRPKNGKNSFVFGKHNQKILENFKDSTSYSVQPHSSYSNKCPISVKRV